jgi:hypothetical protein
MKYIKFLLVTLALFATIGTGFCQRNLILTHGFGDNNNAWNVYQPFLRANLTTPANIFRVGYNSNFGVQSGVNAVNGQIAFNAQNIAIGQSMGGVVLRELDRQLPSQNYGGLITLGSPNRGGALLNALNAGTVQAELNDGCNHVAGAVGSGLVVASVVPSVVSSLFFGVGSTVAIFRGKICDEIIGSLNNKLPATIAPQTATDLSENSGIITALNSSNTPTFKIGVFGVENSPVHMRVLSSLKNDPSQNALSTSSATDNSDQEFVDLFNTVNDVVATGETIFIVASISLSIGAIWFWPLLYPAAICAWAAYEWGALRRWMDQSESKWHAVIGAGGFFEDLVNVRQFACNDALQEAIDLYEGRQITLAQLRLIQRRLTADPNCFAIVPTPISFPINNQSDGLFNAGTQRIPTDPNSNTHVVNLPVLSVNHREFFNHSNMTTVFTQIFAGTSSADRFFITN